MTFKAMKFDTYKSSNSEIQKALKKLGYGWTGYADAPNHFHELARFLWTDIEGRITHSNTENYFLNEETQEYFLYDLLDFVQEKSENVKENPKLQHGNKSIPLGLFSPIAIAYGCIGKLNGRERYGQANYAATNVLLSIYLDAIRRHLDKFAVGQEVDAADNVPHLAAILANVDIILSARAAGTLIDDRALVVGYEEEIEKLIPLVSSLKELNKDKNPRHYTLADKVC